MQVAGRWLAVFSRFVTSCETCKEHVLVIDRPLANHSVTGRVRIRCQVVASIILAEIFSMAVS